MIRAIGRSKIRRRRLPKRSSAWARRIYRAWVKRLPSARLNCMPGRGFLNAFFAFTARSVQTTKETPPDEPGKAIYDPQLSKNGPRCRAAVMLSDGVFRNAHRSSLRRSTIFRRFSHDLLYRLGIVIVVCCFDP